MYFSKNEKNPTTDFIQQSLSFKQFTFSLDSFWDELES